MKARPNPHFAVPPYRAELFSKASGWAGVMNAHGVNCLTFPDKPGAVVSTLEDCEAIARAWNAAAEHGEDYAAGFVRRSIATPAAQKFAIRTDKPIE